ncbi:ATP synthase subunit I [Desulfarculales bacterium]
MRLAALGHKSLTMEFAEAGMLRTLWWGNVGTFVVVSAGALALVNWRTALSVMIGGAIALVNYRLLERTVRRSILPQEKHGVLRKILVKYYLRFAATALVLLILVRQSWAEPLGLLVGLSVVMATIVIWGACQARKLSKEAH